MTVLDHINLKCAMRSESRTATFDRMEHWGLSSWLHEKAKNLSSGTARKLWIEMCWKDDAAVYFLDEPFQGLDAPSIELLCGSLAQASTQAMVVLVAHDWPASLNYDNVMVLPAQANDASS
jgi:ABC-type transport system involved in cytochrome bd biosynthesis fused ATPase/permease subunit